MIGHGGSFAISSQSLSLVLLLLLLPLRGSGGGGVLGLKEESGQIMDGIPNKHRERLEFLTTVLAMDKEWSAFRKEKIKKDFASNINLEKHFCPTLPAFENEMLDSIEISKKIMMHCPYSGLHVEFAVQLMATSVRCLFIKHAKIQLKFVNNTLIESKVNEKFTLHLKYLVEDYQLIFNQLASIGVELYPLIKLVRFFNEDTTTTDKSSIAGKVKKLEELLNSSEDYCAGEIKSMSNDSTKKDCDTLQEDEVSQTLTEKEVDNLRLKLLEEFKNIRFGKLPQEVWKQVFEYFILAKQDQVGK